MSPEPEPPEGSPADPWGPLGLALRDYLNGDAAAQVTVETEGEGIEVMSARHFLRDRGDFPPAEEHALALARGWVLDLGAGAGDHALALQARGLTVTALDVSPLAVEIMRKRGVRDARRGDFHGFAGLSGSAGAGDAGGRYDTVLLMMNGIGLVGDLGGLDAFLERASRLLAPHGQILFDSTDLRLTRDLAERRALEARVREGRYLGEVRFRMSYRGRPGAWFSWLFVDPDALAGHAGPRGWRVQTLFEEEGGIFLARLTRRAG